MMIFHQVHEYLDPVNCEVDEWSEWGDIDKNTGVSQRTRKVIHNAIKSGKECPDLEETRAG